MSSCCLNNRSLFKNIRWGGFETITGTPGTPVYATAQDMRNFQVISWVVTAVAAPTVTLPSFSVLVHDQPTVAGSTQAIQVCCDLDFNDLTGATRDFTSVALEVMSKHIATELDEQRIPLEDQGSYHYVSLCMDAGAEDYDVCCMMGNPLFNFGCENLYDQWSGTLPDGSACASGACEDCQTNPDSVQA